MSIIFYIFLLIIAIFTLIKSGGMLVKNLTKISLFLGLSEFVVSFILMSIITTMPEFFVGVSSAFSGLSILSLTNIIGSNIINLTFIAGIVALISGDIKVKEKLIKDNVWLIFLLTFLPILMLTDGILGRYEGFILLGFFCSYILYLVMQKKKFETVFKKDIKEKENGNKNFWEKTKIFFKNLIEFAINIILLLGSSIVVVNCAKVLAVKLNISLALIGIFLVAIGTSLPELVFGIKSSLSDHDSMSFGNLLGSVAINSTLILGTTAVISPIVIQDSRFFWISSILMLVSVFLFSFFIYTKKEISRKEGLILIFLYLFFIMAIF